MNKDYPKKSTDNNKQLGKEELKRRMAIFCLNCNNCTSVKKLRTFFKLLEKRIQDDLQPYGHREELKSSFQLRYFFLRPMVHDIHRVKV